MESPIRDMIAEGPVMMATIYGEGVVVDYSPRAEFVAGGNDSGTDAECLFTMASAAGEAGVDDLATATFNVEAIPLDAKPGDLQIALYFGPNKTAPRRYKVAKLQARVFDGVQNGWTVWLTE